MIVKPDNTNYEILSSTESTVTFTDGKNIFEVDTKTGQGLTNTGKGQKDLFRLASAFNPTKYLASKSLLSALQAGSSPFINKALDLLNHPNCYVFVIRPNQGSSRDFNCILIEGDLINCTGVSSTLFGKEIPLKYFVEKLKEKLVATHKLPEHIATALFNTNL